MRFPTLVAPLLLVPALALAGAGQISLVMGGGSDPEGRTPTTVAIRDPFAVDFDRRGNVYVAEMAGQRIRKLDRKGRVTTVAGTGEKGFSGDGGPATKAQFAGIHHIVVTPGGDLLVADTLNHRVRRIDARTGVVTTLAGTGEKGFSGDGGPATEALLGHTYCLALDRTGNRLYVADTDNRRIRLVDLRKGSIETVAGNGEKGVPQDGAEALSQPLVDPRAVALDRAGNLYILERQGDALRVMDRKGKIRTIAGNGQRGFSGDGGPALSAAMSGPKHLSVDRKGEVLIVDTENHVIRRYRPRDGTIHRVAGTGQRGPGGLEGPAEKLELARPHGVLEHPSTKALYIADSENHRVVKIAR